MTVRPRNGSKLNITIPEPHPIEHWWEPGDSSPSSIDEEREYDCGYLNLGVESPFLSSRSVSASNVAESWDGATPYIPPRRSSSRLGLSSATNNQSRFNKYAVDRDCGICFEYAVVPCRTLCCGKIFCTEHLAEWLHAEGRCPNCENACSIEGSTLSLASPTKGRRDSVTQAIPGYFHSSPSKHRSNAASTSSQDPLLNQMAAASTKKSSPGSVTGTSSTCSSSTTDYSDTTIFLEDSKQHHTFPTEGSSLSWGILSRLVSILMFLLFLYKLRS